MNNQKLKKGLIKQLNKFYLAYYQVRKLKNHAIGYKDLIYRRDDLFYRVRSFLGRD